MQDTVPDNRRWVLEEIQRDAEADVHRFEGQPFTGQTVAAYLGCQAAAISALARVVATLLPDPPAAVTAPDAEPLSSPVLVPKALLDRGDIGGMLQHFANVKRAADEDGDE